MPASASAKVRPATTTANRRIMRRQLGGRAGRKADLRGLALRVVLHVEELARSEAERACDEGAWDRLDRIVVGQHRVVVDLARDGDPVLRLGDLALELPEVLVGLQLRVRLGHGEEASERLTEQPFRLRRLARRLCLLRGRAGLGDVLEGLALVRGVALDGLDEVRDQVPPPLQLDLDLRP